MIGINVWHKDTLSYLVSSSASIYAIILVCVYIAFAFTDLVTYPKYKDYLELKGFFIYLFGTSIAYQLFFFYQVCCGRFNNAKAVFYENVKSHGSLAIRIGSTIFGVGSITFFLITLASKLGLKSPCFDICSLTTTILAVFFIALQIYLIFFYPRINLCIFKTLNSYGTMHVIATNIILWIRTLIKETLEEIMELSMVHHENQTCNVLLSLAQAAENEEHKCRLHQDGTLPNVVLAASPYLFPFIIEFTLIGASVLFVTSKHIGAKPTICPAMSNSTRVPNAKKWLQKKDCSRGHKGFVTGLGMLVIAIISLCVFFGIARHGQMLYEAELISKIVNIVMNAIGICVVLVGLAEMEQLDSVSSPQDVDPASIIVIDLDVFLLRFSSFFFLNYIMFTIITGIFNATHQDVSNSLHISNGVVEILQIVLQINIICLLKRKLLPIKLVEQKPGRHSLAFLFLFNLAQWLVLTFEIQKISSSIVEAKFYGFASWVVIKRLTLPLAIFFRFHSSVVSIELFKDVYQALDIT